MFHVERWRGKGGGRCKSGKDVPRGTMGGFVNCKVLCAAKLTSALLKLREGGSRRGRLECFNGKLRDECLRGSWFKKLFEERRRIAAWQKEYNEERPHSSLDDRTPNEFAAQAAGQKSNKGFYRNGVG